MLSRPFLPLLLLLALSFAASCGRGRALVISDKLWETAFPGATQALVAGTKAAGWKPRLGQAAPEAFPSSLYDLVTASEERMVVLSPLLALEASALARSWPEKRFAAPGTGPAREGEDASLARSSSNPSQALSLLAKKAAKLPGGGPSALLLLEGQAGDAEEEAFRLGWGGENLLVFRGAGEGPGTESLTRDALASKPRFFYVSLGPRTVDALEALRGSLPDPGAEGPGAPFAVAGRNIAVLAKAYPFILWSVEEDWKALTRAALEGEADAPALLVALR